VFGLDLQSIHQNWDRNILNAKAEPGSNQASGDFVGQSISSSRSRGLYEKLLEDLN